MNALSAAHSAGVGVTPSPLTAAVRARLEQRLTDAAQTRQQQLADLFVALLADEGDLVARAQRDALVQVIEEIARARQRLKDETFGSCVGCGEPIPLERLEIRPWSATCISCATR